MTITHVTLKLTKQGPPCTWPQPMPSLYRGSLDMFKLVHYDPYTSGHLALSFSFCNLNTVRSFTAYLLIVVFVKNVALYKQKIVKDYFSICRFIYKLNL